MKKRALCAALCLTLSITLGGQALAAESGVNFTINGTPVETAIVSQVVDRTTYVSYWPIVQALYPEATAVWANGQAEIRAEGLELNIKPGAQYIECNGRYLYVSEGVKTQGQNILVPVRILGQALGAWVSWDSETDTVVIQATGNGPIASGDEVYQEDVVYWLSRIINAESGNQPLEGKIAVGNVVLNRVASPRFPDTVYEVIFQRNQFTPPPTAASTRPPTQRA